MQPELCYIFIRIWSVSSLHSNMVTNYKTIGEVKTKIMDMNDMNMTYVV